MSNLRKLHEEQSIVITEDFDQLFKEYSENDKKEGQIVIGTVISMDKDYAIIDIGIKSEGTIPISEFSVDGSVPHVNVGDNVEVYIEKLEGRNGLTVLSREKALRNEIWKSLKELHAQDVNVDGEIIGRVKGGFAVKLGDGGIVAFLPGSQVDVRPIKDMSILMDISQPFKILKMDDAQGNVVVSRRAILEESRKEARDELLSNINEGSILKGVVKNITDYGAFVDLKSTDGLLHITDISWSKISHPSEVLSVGQHIDVMVIKYNPDSQRISLGLKQLTKNPWELLKDKYKVGTKVSGRISSVVDYGAFITLEPNIEGLVYHTEIDWLSKNIHPNRLVSAGQDVEVMVLDIDITKHRISLSIKQCKQNPWIEFIEKYPVGTKIKGSVRNITDFGIFIVKEESANDEIAIIMLIPAVELSWDKNPEEELKKYNKGDIIDCVIISTDTQRERIGVSIRQYNEDTASIIAKSMINKESVKVKVLNVTPESIEIEVANNINTNVPKIELSKNKEEQDTARFNVDDIIDIKIVGYDSGKGSIIASIKAMQYAQEANAMSEYNIGGADSDRGGFKSRKDNNYRGNKDGASGGGSNFRNNSENRGNYRNNNYKNNNQSGGYNNNYNKNNQQNTQNNTVQNTTISEDLISGIENDIIEDNNA